MIIKLTLHITGHAISLTGSATVSYLAIDLVLAFLVTLGCCRWPSAGFLGLMKTAIRRNQMRKLNHAMQGESISWENTTVRSMFMGMAALLREDQELASTQRPRSALASLFLECSYCL